MSVRRDFVHDGENLRVSVRALAEDRFEVTVGDRRHEVAARRLPNGLVSLRVGGRSVVAATARAGDRLQVRVAGHTWTLEPARGRTRGGGAAAAGTGRVEAPMTGTVLRIAVEPGQRVEVGDTVAVLSAMKMEHTLAADTAGEVVEVGAADGENVEQGALLVRIEPAAPTGA